MEGALLSIAKAAHSCCDCPICTYLLTDPVVLPCGHVFCLRCATQCIEGRPRCPLCNSRVPDSRRSLSPLPNLTLLTGLLRGLVAKATTTTTDVVLDFAPFESTPSGPSYPLDGTPLPLSALLTLATQQLGGVAPSPQRARLSPGSGPFREGDVGVPAGGHSPRPAGGPVVLVMVPPSALARVGGVAVDGARSWGGRGGQCVFCGLDLTDRDGMRGYLMALLHSRRAACDVVELNGLTEDQFAEMLGPNWRLQCRRGVDVGGGSAKEGTEAAVRMGTHDDAERGELLGPEAVAHHNCLVWSGVLPDGDLAYTTRPYDASPECTPEPPAEGLTTLTAADEEGLDCYWSRAFPSHPVVHAFPDLLKPGGGSDQEPPYCEADCRLVAVLLSKLSRATLANGRGDCDGNRHCEVCGRGASRGLGDSILGLRRCEAAARASPRNCRRRCRRYFHFPCALLAGAKVCMVYGVDEGKPEDTEVWCGHCHRALEEAKPQTR